MSFLPVAVATALVAGAALGLAWPGLLTASAGTAGASLATAWLAWRLQRPALLLVAGLAGALALGAVLGATAMMRARTPALVEALLEGAGGGTELPVEPVRLEGRFAGDATSSAGRPQFVLRVRRVRAGPCGCSTDVSGDVLVTVGGGVAAEAMAGWRSGRAVSVVATVRRPTSLRNPGGPDPEWALARRRIAALAAVKSALLVEVTARGSWPAEGASALRARARAAIVRAAGAGSDAAAVATAILIGDRAGLSASLEERLQRAGTFHVIAISGGNVAIWAALAVGLASRVTRRRLVGLAGASLALVAYAALVGGGASVLRATGMAVVGIACQAADLRGAALNVLALTAALLVALDPVLVLDAGFWLTTAATAGLVAGMPALTRDEPMWRRWLRALVLTSIWAEVALLPVVTAVFQQVTLAGLLLSALAIPASVVVQLTSLVAVAADAITGAAAPWAGVVLRTATGAITESARLVDLWPWLTWRVPPPSPASITVYYAAVAGWLAARRLGLDSQLGVRARQVSTAVAGSAALWIAASPATLIPAPPGAMSLIAFDVGQGDALLIETPGGHRVLVDAGGVGGDGRDVGGRVVGMALRALGIRRLDYLVVTHPDLDHVGGAATIIREFGPTEVWVGVPVAEHVPLDALRAAADAAGAAWREVRAGDRVALGDATIEVRHPPRPEWQRLRPRNDDSVVLDVRWRDARFVLTGDIGIEVEQALAADLRAGVRAPLTVVKVAHHGSAGSTSAPWLDALAPRLALVSAGAANPFGHPAPAVLGRLQAAAVDVWRTDRDGAIHVRTDGRTATVRAMSGRTALVAPQPR